MGVNDIFFNQFGRLRSGWRFLIFQLMMIFGGTLLGFGVRAALQNAPIGDGENSLLSFVVPNLILLSLAIFCGWLCGKLFEDLPFRALGASFTKNWWRDLSIGLIFGALAISLAVAIAVVFGGMRLDFNQNAGAAAILLTLSVSLVVFVVGAAAEEAYFRGYILQTFARANLAWLAIAFTAIFFGFAHFNNPNVGTVAKINTVLAGIWFGIAYLKTRNLWFPFGIHLTWNWLQGAFYGIPVSGITELTTAPLLQTTAPGTDLISGGAYGLEGGIACLGVIIAAIALTYFMPFLKPNEEMLLLTNAEKSRGERNENRV